MTSQIDSLHKILKDETRRSIILLLNDKGAQSHTELMDTMGFATTGLLNYHLKMLGTLVAKNEAGQYTLTEKGKVASRLLIEFPEESPQRLKLKPKWWGRFWKSTAVFAVATVAFNSALYFYGVFSLHQFIEQSVWILGVIGITYMAVHIGRDVASEKNLRRLSKAFYVLLGTTGLGFLLWLGVTKLLQVTDVTGGLFASGPTVTITFLACYIVGAFVGNWVGKKRNYRIPGSLY